MADLHYGEVECPWENKTLEEKLQDVVSEAGAVLPDDVSLSDFRFYGAHSYHGLSDRQVKKQVQALERDNPDACIFEAPAPVEKVRTFWVLFKQEPSLTLMTG